jgi:lipopolysaccharide transport system ATP-binding protein
VTSLGKRYRLGLGGAAFHYKALRDVLTDAIYAPFRRLRGGLKSEARSPNPGYIWALKDLSFEVEQGEVLGIIGRNGAGKTTLLKILSRVTEPTEGEAEIQGRVGSLLEVGTGFHPELTGRENVYLNGAILGMNRGEIRHKFDEIVSFAELEEFLDTPVKRYSSGMYMRLAFSVAAHLEPEILLVDEVLAVGDAAFQKKCLGKMGDVAQQGRTVLFVSHNMAAVLSLCTRAMMLESGRLVRQGDPRDVVQNYLDAGITSQVTPLDQRTDRQGDGSARVVALEIASADGEKAIRTTTRLKVTLRYKSDRPLQHPTFLVGMYDIRNIGAFLLNSDGADNLPDVLPAEGSVVCVTDPINLTPGRCYVNIALRKGSVMADYIQQAAYFDVEAEDVHGSGKIPTRDWMLCVVKHEWALGED